MPLSPRTLRPSSNWTPKSISGLALWLDASSADTLYATDAGPVTAVSSPTEISGCVLWLDGADATSMFDATSGGSQVTPGGLISRWQDKSVLGNHATATTTARPTLTSAGLNGKSVVTFDGTANAMQVAANSAFNSNDMTYIVVFKQAAVANKGVYTKMNASAGTNGFGLAVRSDPQVWLLQKNAAAAQVLTSSANPTTQARIYSVTSSSSATGYLDGLSSATGASTADHSLVQRVMVGSRDSSEYLNGYIAEVIHYNRVLTRSELAQVEALLATKWGISGVHRSASQEIAAVTSPTEIAGCAGWWDCSRTDKMFNATTGGSLVSNGGAVLRLEDLSGNGKHLVQATSASAPSRQDGAKNGLPALNFAGTKALAAGAAGDWNFLHNTQGGTVIAVIKPYDTADPNTFAYGVATNVGGATNGIGWSSFFDDRVSYPRNNHVSQSVTAGVSGQTVVSQEQNNAIPSTNDFSLLSFTPFAGSSTTAGRGGMYVSGTATGNANSSTLAPSASNSNHALTVGTAGGNSIAGLAELIVYSTVLTAVDRARVEKYLQQKWATPTVPDPTPPVGYWGDKSGNARHATQATASYRPVVQTNAIASRTALKFDGSNDWLATANINSVFPSAATAFIVCYPSTSSATNWTVFSTGANHWDVYSGSLTYAGTFRSPRVSGIATSIKYNAGEPLILRYRSSSTSWSQFVNGLASVETAGAYNAASGNYSPAAGNAGVGYTIGSDLSGATINGSFKDYICEVLLYNSSLSDADCKRVERQLATKWSASLRPSVSNADAQDWIRRVYLNGGTVSASTAAAVNTFCDAIDAASIRDRFYRMGIFCGSNLNAALVPLYLTPDKTVTNLYQFGTDMTNAAWQPGGNGAWTRAASTEVGPLGYGYATKLTTPTPSPETRQLHQLLPVQNRQVTLSVWLKTNTGTRQVQWFINGEYLDTFTVSTTWTRYTKTYTSTASANDGRTGLVSVSELNDTLGFIYGWGMQCEYGAAATSYNQPRYGNTTDTNNAFVGVGTDYAETGASGGLTGNGSSKYLQTGFPGNALAVGSRHLSAYEISRPATAYKGLIGTQDDASGTYYFSLGNGSPETITSANFQTSASATGQYSGGHWVASDTSSPTSLVLYKNGLSAAASADTARSIPSSQGILVFGYNANTSSVSPGGLTNARLGGYSIGLGMTSTQAAAYYTAMQAFQTALTRNA